jgi:hypothetical protein
MTRENDILGFLGIHPRGGFVKKESDVRYAHQDGAS